MSKKQFKKKYFQVVLETFHASKMLLGQCNYILLPVYLSCYKGPINIKWSDLDIKKEKPETLMIGYR
jgi:hypothetical protein